MWPAAPKTFERFWELVESSKPLQTLLRSGDYEANWWHCLFYHLGEIWDREGWPTKQPTLRTGQRGRPRHLQSPDPFKDFELSLCVLNLIVMVLLGSRAEQGNSVGTKHWKISVDLLKHFLPTRFPPTWDRRNLQTCNRVIM
jgi:hypothetical protein